MKLTQKDVDQGVAALDQLRERIVPKHFETSIEVFEGLIEEFKSQGATHIRHVLFWDKKNAWLTLAHSAVGGPDNPHGLGNDTHPCPPCCPDCP